LESPHAVTAIAGMFFAVQEVLPVWPLKRVARRLVVCTLY
jgi:hypothetical protein